MIKRYAWSKHSDDELWHGGPCDSLRDCVEEAVENGYSMEDTFAVGLIEEYNIDLDFAWRIIEDLQEDAYDEVGEASDSWLDCTTREQRDELNSRIHKIVREWLKEIHEEPSFYKVLPCHEITLKEAMDIHNEKVASMVRGGKIDV